MPAASRRTPIDQRCRCPETRGVHQAGKTLEWLGFTPDQPSRAELRQGPSSFRQSRSNQGGVRERASGALRVRDIACMPVSVPGGTCSFEQDGRDSEKRGGRDAPAKFLIPVAAEIGDWRRSVRDVIPRSNRPRRGRPSPTSPAGRTAAGSPHAAAICCCEIGWETGPGPVRGWWWTTCGTVSPP